MSLLTILFIAVAMASGCAAGKVEMRRVPLQGGMILAAIGLKIRGEHLAGS